MVDVEKKSNLSKTNAYFNAFICVGECLLSHARTYVFMCLRFMEAVVLLSTCLYYSVFFFSRQGLSLNEISMDLNDSARLAAQ